MSLVPSETGARLTKAEVVVALQAAALASGLSRVEANKVSGHSPRAVGAQLFSMAGVHLWRIQRWGRWGSAAILRYTREAILGMAGSVAVDVKAGLPTMDLDAVKEMVNAHGSKDRSVALYALLEKKFEDFQADVELKLKDVRNELEKQMIEQAASTSTSR